MWLALAPFAALCQVLRNTVMKRLGHSLDEYINVWGHVEAVKQVEILVAMGRSASTR